MTHARETSTMTDSATDVSFVGGTDADRQELLALHRAYLAANNVLDIEALRDVWDADPGRVFFNLNGHTYHGFEHWGRLWAHYKTRFKTTNPWTTTNTRVVIGTDMALITCERTSRLDWIGDGPSETFTQRDLTSRSTEVYGRTEKGWRVIHVHFSPASDDTRPGGI